MAARTRKPFHDDATRQKIKTSQLVNCLQDHVLKGTNMSKTQITAALGLLKKTLPDLTATELSGDVTLNHEAALDELS